MQKRNYKRLCTIQRAWAVLAILLLNFLLLVCVMRHLHGTEESVQTLSQLGEQGDEVRQLQQKLRSLGFYSGAVDGMFSPALRKAVKHFQQTQKLPVTGLADIATLTALGLPQENAPNSLDCQLLARYIQCKAGSGSYREKLAAGAIALNRVKDEHCPDTLAGVLLQSGWGISARELLDAVPDSQSKKAAEACMDGWDTTGGGAGG